MATLLDCPTCGRATDTDAGRFCGGCGTLLRPHGTGPAEDVLPSGPADAGFEERLRDRWPARRAAAVSVVVLAVVLAALAVTREPVEVVTADGLGTSSGVTSNLAVTDISTEHWRLSLLRAVPDQSVGRLSTAARSGDLLIAAGVRTTALDLASGEVRGEIPWSADGTPLLQNGRLVVAVRDRLLEVDPIDGAVVAATRLELEVSLRPVAPRRVPGGLLVVDGDRLSLVTDGGRVPWQTEPPVGGPVVGVTAVGDAVVVAGRERLAAIGLEDGDLQWRSEVTRLRPGRFPDPVVADGLIHTVEAAATEEAAWDPAGGMPTARDVATGHVVWRAEELTGAQQIGVRDGVLLAASRIAEMPRLLRIDAATGETLPPLAVEFPVRGDAATLGPPGLVLLPDPSGGVVAVDDETGERRWDLVDVDAWSTVVVDDLVVVAGTFGVRVVSAEGDVLHRLPAAEPGAPSQIAISGRTAVVAPGLAVDLADGGVRFRDPGAQRWSDPMVVSGGFVVRGHAGVYVVDRHGARRWSLAASGGTGRSIVAVVEEGTVVAGGGARARLELLDRDGQLIGRPLDDHTMWRATVAGDLVVGHRFRQGRVDADQNDLLAVRAGADGLEAVWDAPAAGGVLLAEGDAVYELTTVALTRRSLDDGRVVGTAALPRVVEPDRAALAGGTLVLVSGDQVLGIDPDSGQLLWDEQLAAPVTGGPTIAGDVVYVGTADGDVVLLGLDGQPVATRDAADGEIRGIVAAHGVVVAVTDREAFGLGPPVLPSRATEPEPTEIGTVDVPIP